MMVIRHTDTDGTVHRGLLISRGFRFAHIILLRNPVQVISADIDDLEPLDEAVYPVPAVQETLRRCARKWGNPLGVVARKALDMEVAA